MKTTKKDLFELIKNKYNEVREVSKKNNIDHNEYFNANSLENKNIYNAFMISTFRGKNLRWKKEDMQKALEQLEIILTDIQNNIEASKQAKQENKDQKNNNKKDGFKMKKLIKKVALTVGLLFSIPTITEACETIPEATPEVIQQEQKETITEVAPEETKQNEYATFNYKIIDINYDGYIVGESIEDNTKIFLTSEHVNKDDELNLNDVVIAYFEKDNTIDGLIKVEKKEEEIKEYNYKITEVTEKGFYAQSLTAEHITNYFSSSSYDNAIDLNKGDIVKIGLRNNNVVLLKTIEKIDIEKKVYTVTENNMLNTFIVAVNDNNSNDQIIFDKSEVQQELLNGEKVISYYDKSSDRHIEIEKGLIAEDMSVVPMSFYK